jgi:hypothetical protein
MKPDYNDSSSCSDEDDEINLYFSDPEMEGGDFLSV